MITIYTIIHVIRNSYKRNIIHFELAIRPDHLLTDQVITHTGESQLRNHLCNLSCNQYWKKSLNGIFNTIVHVIVPMESRYDLKRYSVMNNNFELAVIPVHPLIDQVIIHTGENHFRNHICNHSCISTGEIIFRKRTIVYIIILNRP